MGTCKNCRHWTAFAHYDHVILLWGSCKLGESNGYDPETSGTRMFAVVDDGDDPSDISCVVDTREDFGCVMFQEKSE